MKMSPFKLASTILILLCTFFFACNNNPGVQEEFYPDGTIKSSAQVKNGLRNGTTKMYDERGRLTSTAEFVNDQHEGWTINYNPENGKVVAKAFYKNDKQNGPVTLYYKEGQIYRKMKYVDDHVDSIVTTYWPNGKVQAEDLFQKGNPAIGLKEWDDQGNPIKEPTLVVKEINQVALFGKVTLVFSISDGTKEVDYYLDNLKDGKFLDQYSSKLKNVNGSAKIDYLIPRGKTLMKKVSVIAKLRTELGNTLVLQKTYNLSVSN